MSDSVDADVVVIGAGPGGASTAFFLKHLDTTGELKVLLFERLDSSRFRRYHRMCGEGISRRAFKNLGPLEPCGIIHDIDRIEIRWPGGVVGSFRDRGYILDRSALLSNIIGRFEDRGGQTIKDSVDVVGAVSDGFELLSRSGERIRCSYLVGADGASSTVRRQIFQEQPPVRVMLHQYLVSKEMDPHKITFVSDNRYHGKYRWEFPFGDLAKVGFPHGTDSIDEYVEKHSRLMCFGGLTRIVRGGACLVGDAAAQANPLTLGGIRVAMEAGRKAAECMIRKDLSRYQRWWDRSGFSSSKFMKAHDLAAELSNQEMYNLVKPFNKPYGYIQHAINFIRWPRNRPLYSSYIGLPRFGW